MLDDHRSGIAVKSITLPSPEPPAWMPNLDPYLPDLGELGMDEADEAWELSDI